jgi:hypothetical protein
MAGPRKNGKTADLFVPPESVKTAPPAQYAPLPSVWYGTDAELLERMLDYYPRKTPGAILNATVNAGRFWVGSERPVTGMDIDPKYKPDVVGGQHGHAV